jgi:hexosaminidase
VRIWGTNEPGKTSSVSKNVTIQHWEFFEDNPLDLLNQGYKVLNSDDAFYIVAKFSGSYPQSLNVTKIFTGNPAGGAYAPYTFDTRNATNNPPRAHPGVVGHIAAQWNDFGPNASTVLEAYYDWKNGLAALADKQWGGNLTETQFHEVFGQLQAAVPAQNLDRNIPSKTNIIVSYDFSEPSGDSDTVVDASGNEYDALLQGGARILPNSTVLFPTSNASLLTPLTSKGFDYTLSFSIYPSSPLINGSPILTGPDSQLIMGNGSITNTTLLTGGNPYSLNYTLPMDAWTDVQLIGRGNATFLKVGSEEMRFLAVLGINGRSNVWRDVAIVAPLKVIGGFKGMMARLVLRNGA